MNYKLKFLRIKPADRCTQCGGPVYPGEMVIKGTPVLGAIVDVKLSEDNTFCVECIRAFVRENRRA